MEALIGFTAPCESQSPLRYPPVELANRDRADYNLLPATNLWMRDDLPTRPGRSRRGDSSAPHPLVHDVEQRLPRDKPPQVLQQRLQMPLGNARRCSGAVRRDNHVLHAPQRMLPWQRLDLEDVQPRPRDVA